MTLPVKYGRAIRIFLIHIVDALKKMVEFTSGVTWQGFVMC